MKSFKILTFGCQMNEHDSEKMAGLLKAEGYHESDRLEDASLILINTCSIREKAEQKFYSEIGKLRKLKEINPNSEDSRIRLHSPAGGKIHPEARALCGRHPGEPEHRKAAVPD